MSQFIDQNHPHPEAAALFFLEAVTARWTDPEGAMQQLHSGARVQ